MGGIVQARFSELSRGRKGGYRKRPRHRAVRWNRADSKAVEGTRPGRAGNRGVARRERVSRCVHGQVRETRVRAPRVPEEVSVWYPNREAGR